MKEQASVFPVDLLCRVMRISRSGYYAFLKRAPSRREIANQELIGLMTEIQRDARGCYGSPRMMHALRACGLNANHKRIARLMRIAKLSAKQRKRYKQTTNSYHNLPICENKLQRDFAASRPNQKWFADITYVWTNEGWLYVAAVLEAYSRKVIGLAMGARMTQELVATALKQAVSRRHAQPGLIVHTDRGSQYASEGYQQLLKQYQITGSMSGKGNCYDNAMMESFFHSFKTEQIHFQQYQTRQQAEIDILLYVETFYNPKRLHSALGYLSPNQFEAKTVHYSCVHGKG